MTPPHCPKCGRQATSEHTCCPECGQEWVNGTSGLRAEPAGKPPIPAEAASWAIEKVPPHLLEWARQTINEEEILNSIREIEATGGLQLEDFIDEIEKAALGRE
jgi:hypothetical protein